LEGRTLLELLKWLPATVTEARLENAHVRSITFNVPGWSGHRPGQHLDVRLTAEDGYQARRSYSVATPSNGESVTITAELVQEGEVSPYLIEVLQPGDSLEVYGPIGGYFVWEGKDTCPLLLVAGGSGIVPLMCMLRHRAILSHKIPTKLLYSVRSPEDRIYAEELAELANKQDGLELLYTYTRVAPEGWTGFKGRVNAEMLRQVAYPVHDHQVAYVCGPTSFVEVVASSLLNVGLEAEDILTERFGPSGS
jgi:ferredoxin-NADP reductase